MHAPSKISLWSFEKHRYMNMVMIDTSKGPTFGNRTKAVESFLWQCQQPHKHCRPPACRQFIPPIQTPFELPVHKTKQLPPNMAAHHKSRLAKRKTFPPTVNLYTKRNVGACTFSLPCQSHEKLTQTGGICKVPLGISAWNRSTIVRTTAMPTGSS